MDKNVKLPKSWGLSPHQEYVIGSLMDHAGDWVSSEALTKALYGTPEKPAPAKLRVTVMRCRDIVFERSNGRVEIDVKKGSGWKFKVRDAMILKKFIEKAG